MAKAQRLRWNKIKQAAAPETAKLKRKMSASARKRIAAAEEEMGGDQESGSTVNRRDEGGCNGLCAVRFALISPL